MGEIETSFGLKTMVSFRIIPFDDALWRAVFPQLKEQLGIEQINIVESQLYLSAFKHYYDVYVDKALIDKYGMKVVNEIVREKIKERIDKEMERDFKFLIDMEGENERKNKNKTLCESFDVFLERKSLSKDDWEMKCPYKVGDEYWFIFDNGHIDIDCWEGHATDFDRFKTGNVFPTEEAAQLEAKRRNLLTRFRAFRDECNDGWKPDFSDDEEKYYLYYSILEECIDVGWIVLGCSFNIFGYFKNQEDAERAIELFGDEIIELYVDNEV